MTRTTGAYHYHKIANSALQIRLVSEQSDCNNWLLCSSHSRLHWSHHRTQIIFLNSIDNILQSACRSLNFTNVPNRSVISRHIYTADYCTSVVSLLLNIQTDATKGATTGGGLGGVRTPQLSGGPPNFWHHVFVEKSTVKPAEWIRCIIQKKKERRNSCYYCSQ